MSPTDQAEIERVLSKIEKLADISMDRDAATEIRAAVKRLTLVLRGQRDLIRELTLELHAWTAMPAEEELVALRTPEREKRTAAIRELVIDPGLIDSLRSRLAAAEEREKALLEDLAEYAHYSPGCALGGTVGGKPVGCDCGLDAARERHGIK